MPAQRVEMWMPRTMRNAARQTKTIMNQGHVEVGIAGM